MPKTIKNPKLIVIVGPTASGKSSLAVRLAKKFNGEIVSADSRQVYKGLDIGTGKITKKEMQGVPHHLLDVANPKRIFSAADYTRLAKKAIREIYRSKKIPIVVGGTGFYINALLGTTSLPNVPPNRALRARLTKKSTEQLFALLKKIDPRRAITIDAKNPRRLVRAIEIATLRGSVPPLVRTQKYDPLFIGLALPDTELRAHIALRLHEHIRKGMIREVRQLRRQGLSWKRLDDLGLEYRYVARYLQGNLNKKELPTILEKKIGHYARRQKTWWKHDARIRWFPPTAVKKIEKVVKNFLAER